MTQCSIRPKRYAIRAQAAYFLHSMMPSVTCLRLSDASVICSVTYFQFPIQSAFLPHISVARPHQHYGVLLVLLLISNIGHRTLPRIWVGTFLVRNVQPRGRLWIDSNGKMETGHREEGQFGSEFPAICNHCKVMTAWSRKTWKCNFFPFFGNKVPYGKIFIILF